MWAFLAALAAVTFWLVAGRRLWREYRLGIHLTRMTNVFEQIELTRLRMPIGMGGGIDSLSSIEQSRAVRTLEQGVLYLRAFPRHEVTTALMRNATIANSLNRTMRLRGMDRLLDFLIGRDVAINFDEFAASYAN